MPDDRILAGLDPYDLLDAEADRIERYFAGIDDASAARPSRCPGWSVRDVLAHLAATEEYHHACLDDTLPDLLARAAEAGVTGLDGFNAWGIETRAGRGVAELLEEWTAANRETRARMRERDGGTLSTSVGPYPVRWQAFHVASELATHADDAWVPVEPDEEPARTSWRARFSVFALAEERPAVEVEPAGEQFRVRVDAAEAVMPAADLVEAVMGRLAPERPIDERVRAALPVV